MNIVVTVNINAPELATAIGALAMALSCQQTTPAITEIAATAQPSALEIVHEKPVIVHETPETVHETTKTERKTAKKPITEVAPEPTPAAAPEPKPEPVPEVSLEQVRDKLATLSSAGKRAQVKELLSQFGVSKLTEIPKERYAELLAAAEAIV